MTNDQAIKERAKQIDPCAFKSYSGSARRDAQQVALDQAQHELENESCSQRRYTLDEIDRMRVAIRRVQPPHINYATGRPSGAPSIEDQVRTAMLGGVDPQELEDKADLYWEAIRERREARRREQEADAARVRAGGQPIYAMTEAAAVVADVPVNSFWKGMLIRRIEAAILSCIKRKDA